MSKVRSDNISNRADDGAPALVYGAEVPVGYGITGAGGINITGVCTAASASFTGNVSVGGVLTYEDVASIDSVGIITARSDVSIADKIVHTGDTDTAIRFPAANQFSVETAGAQRILIGSDGKLVHSSSASESIDFGTSNGSGSYHKYDLGASGATVGYIGSGNAIVSGANAADFGVRGQANLVFSSGGDTERLRITSSGVVLVATDSARTNFNDSGIETRLQIETAGDNDSAALSIISNAGTTNSDKRSGLLVLGRTRGTSNGATTVVVEDDQVGMIEFKGMDGTSFTTAGSIKAQVDGSCGTDDMPGRLVFSTSADGSGVPTERFRIDSVGRLLIGTTALINSSTASNFQIANASGPRLCIARNDTSTAESNLIGALDFYGNDSNGTYELCGRILAEADADHTTDSKLTRLTFYTAGSDPDVAEERLRISSDGKVLVGTEAGRSAGDVNGQLQVEGTTFHAASMNLISNTGASAGNNVHISLCKSRGTSDGSNTVVASGDNLGTIQWCGADGTDLNSVAAMVQAFVDETPGSNDMPGRLSFWTTPDGAAAPSERARIDRNGALMIGNDVDNPGDANTNAGIAFRSNGKYFLSCASDGGHINRNNDGAIIHCRRSGSLVGSVSVNSSSTSFNTSSDYRLKENVVDLNGAITRVKQLAPKRFNFIINADKTVDGFLAHEAQTVVPEAVTGTHNEVDGDGNAVMQGIDQSKLVPLLTAALKESIAEIESLKTRVAALEG